MVPTLRAPIHLVVLCSHSSRLLISSPPPLPFIRDFACDTITSRIILRFCYSAPPPASVVPPSSLCLLLLGPVNVAKLMPFDYIANHEYGKAQLLHHPQLHDNLHAETSHGPSGVVYRQQEGFAV